MGWQVFHLTNSVCFKECTLAGGRVDGTGPNTSVVKQWIQPVELHKFHSVRFGSVRFPTRQLHCMSQTLKQHALKKARYITRSPVMALCVVEKINKMLVDILWQPMKQTTCCPSVRSSCVLSMASVGLQRNRQNQQGPDGARVEPCLSRSHLPHNCKLKLKICVPVGRTRIRIRIEIHSSI